MFSFVGNVKVFAVERRYEKFLRSEHSDRIHLHVLMAFAKSVDWIFLQHVTLTVWDSQAHQDSWAKKSFMEACMACFSAPALQYTVWCLVLLHVVHGTSLECCHHPDFIQLVTWISVVVTVQLNAALLLWRKVRLSSTLYSSVCAGEGLFLPTVLHVMALFVRSARIFLTAYRMSGSSKHTRALGQRTQCVASALQIRLLSIPVKRRLPCARIP